MNARLTIAECFEAAVLDRAHEEAKAVNARLEYLFRVEGFDWDSALEMALEDSEDRPSVVEFMGRWR